MNVNGPETRIGVYQIEVWTIVFYVPAHKMGKDGYLKGQKVGVYRDVMQRLYIVYTQLHQL